ncbi:hypothetical protein FB45DRAFT_1059215 [Roridomyces roridus]|uniref:Nnf1 n=1 Tax=Roridomyces roridus TaxID=1738132 RepID=A0AAD7BR93_9AGAR|nr:hypothetical protein FB45DRAFT_1059215 [Roridomyces roridus]
MSRESHSRRWKYFHSALELAVAKSAHEWKFEDFEQCFPQLVKEDKDSATQIFSQIAGYIESTTKRDLDRLFEVYDLKKNIDILDEVVKDAKARKGDVEPSVWTEQTRPRAAVYARTVPALEARAQRLKEQLAEMEAQNLDLISQLESKNEQLADLTGRSAKILEAANETGKSWRDSPMDSVQGWTAQAVETLTPIRHP